MFILDYAVMLCIFCIQVQVTSDLNQMEALEADLTINVLPQLEREVEMAKSSRSHMQMTMQAVQSKKKELTQQLLLQSEVNKELLTRRSEAFCSMISIHNEHLKSKY